MEFIAAAITLLILAVTMMIISTGSLELIKHGEGMEIVMTDKKPDWKYFFIAAGIFVAGAVLVLAMEFGVFYY